VTTAVIAGSGMETLFSVKKEKKVGTEHGAVTVYLCSTQRSDFFFLPRHGKGHEVPPHLINHKANLSALSSLGVRSVIATCAVGSISGKLEVGGLGLLDQFIDMSKRHVTFFDTRPVHVDMTYPYDGELQDMVARAGSLARVKLKRGLTYVSVDGPRYETAAEVRMLGMLGGDVVGMTGAPEAILANELGIKYASIVVATNKGAGLQDAVTHEEVLALMAKTAPMVKRLIQDSIDGL
jgi:5'-methylthioadenosine phosphorylase